jgi:protein phosphatase
MDAQELNDKSLHGYAPELVGGATDAGPRRSENQDIFWIPDESSATHLGTLILVADGVGGQEDGADAAQLAALTSHRVFYDQRQQGKAIPAALKDALEQANQAVYEEAQDRDVKRMGSTFVAAVQDAGLLVVAHVGDARAYLVRQGELRQLTRDDTWVQRQVEAGLITEEEAAKHEFRNVVTQVLGNKPEINVHLSQTHALQQGDIVLLCSDGLYDVLADSRMVSLLTDNGAKSAARLLVEEAIRAEATDNITAVVMRMDPLVPLADEPTIVPPPVELADEPALVPVAAAAAPVSPPPVDKKGKVAKWLIVLAIIAVVLIIATPVAFWLSNQNAEGEPAAAEPTIPAEGQLATQDSPSALRPVGHTRTIQAATVTDQERVATIEPPATATIPPLDTAISLPTPTLVAAPEPGGCANGRLFPYIWNDTQINAGCGTTFLELEVGDEVRILSDQPIAPGGNCGVGRFIKIRSIADATLEGWVHEGAIDLIAPGESCSP